MTHAAATVFADVKQYGLVALQETQVCFPAYQRQQGQLQTRVIEVSESAGALFRKRNITVRGATCRSVLWHVISLTVISALRLSIGKVSKDVSYRVFASSCI